MDHFCTEGMSHGVIGFLRPMGKMGRAEVEVPPGLLRNVLKIVTVLLKGGLVLENWLYDPHRS
jgi:hypothetical protein